MPIVAGDIDFFLSGGGSNSDPALSLGGAKSSTQCTGSTLFDTVSAAESAAGDIEYRCIYVHNSHGSLAMLNPRIWIQANTPSADTTIDIALGGEGLNGTAETVPNEGTAPSGETFVAAANEGAALTTADIPAGQHYPVWIRRTVNAAAAPAADTFTIRVKCDTAA